MTISLKSMTNLNTIARSLCGVTLIGAFAFSCSKPESTKDVRALYPFPDLLRSEAIASSGLPGKVIANRGGLRRVTVFDEGEYGVDFWTTEIHGNNTYRSQVAVTTSFAIARICARHPDQVFVAGYDEQTGDSIIERWTYSPPTGALAGSMHKATSGQGFPVPFHWPEVSIVGGAFIPPSERVQVLPPTRVEVYRGDDFTGISGIAADPEGRFLLVQDVGTGSIYQIYPGSSPVMIVDAVTNPEFSSAVLRPPFQDGFDDRVYCFQLASNGQYVVIHDPENDGVFGSAQVISKYVLDQVFPLEPYGQYQLMR